MRLSIRLRSGLTAFATGSVICVAQAQSIPTPPVPSPPPGAVPQPEELLLKRLRQDPNDGVIVPTAPTLRELGKPADDITPE